MFSLLFVVTIAPSLFYLISFSSCSSLRRVKKVRTLNPAYDKLLISKLEEDDVRLRGQDFADPLTRTDEIRLVLIPFPIALFPCPQPLSPIHVALPRGKWHYANYSLPSTRRHTRHIAKTCHAAPMIAERFWKDWRCSGRPFTTIGL